MVAGDSPDRAVERGLRNTRDDPEILADAVCRDDLAPEAHGERSGGEPVIGLMRQRQPQAPFGCALGRQAAGRQRIGSMS